MNTESIIKENIRRLNEISKIYDPITGEGSTTFERIKIDVSDYPIQTQYIPIMMYKKSKVCKELKKLGSIKAYLVHHNIEPTEENIDSFKVQLYEERCDYDFEYFAITHLTIEDGEGKGDIPFRLNRGQRRLLTALEKQRIAGKPIRIILLKARQWGGSTLIQLYMLWIQLRHKKKWHSVICAHLDQAAKHIRGMYSRALKNYPSIDGTKYELRPYEGTQNIKVLNGRECRITVGSAESPDSVRSQSAFMIHYSEVALYPSTDGKKPEDLIGAISSAVKRLPYTLIAYESTAKGVGNFFHTQWVKAKEGKSAFITVFVEWFLIDSYSEKLTVPYEKFVNSLSEYELMLFDKGATLENINWYRGKSGESASEKSMKEEYPSDDIEAFQNSGSEVFIPEHVERLRKDCINPLYVGDVEGMASASKAKILPNLRSDVLKDVRFYDDKNGPLKIWSLPEYEKISNRYVIFVDTGGRGIKSDWSVAAVFDRYWMMYGGVPEVVAEWRGHVDHDILVWKCAALATFYDNALLAFESNTHDMEKNNDTDGDHSEFIFDTISHYYSNLYSRVPPDKIKEGLAPKWGFITNHPTKARIIDTYTAILREKGYKERESGALDEARWYEKKPNGNWGNVEGQGKHDDRIITRMAGLQICYELPLPEEIKENINYNRTIISESTI